MSNLAYQNLTFKASHNSYDRNETLTEQITWHSDDPSNCGCRGIELDIWRESSDFVPYESINSDYFKVAHVTPVFGAPKLSDYLAELKEWHNDNPGHDPIFVVLDIKSSHGGFSDFNVALDTYLGEYFGRDLIFKPNELFYSEDKDLCENVIANGWPSVEDESMRGKFIFCLSGNKEWKQEYADTDLKKALCFSDKDESGSDSGLQPPTSGNIIFFNFHVYTRDLNNWSQSIPRFTAKNMFTRAYVANGENLWDNCVTATFSVVATDKVSGHSWCYVNPDAPYLEK